MEINYPNLFSSTTPQINSDHDLHLLNMVNSHALDHDHGHHKPNNGYMGLIASMELPRSSDININGNYEEAKPDQMKKMIKNKDEKKSRNPKYAFQTRSQVDILDDGYRWRKYGQKAVKNNKFPRSYYRCTHQGCNVKKQIQRLSKDEGVVVTTYEGMHSHPILKSTDNFEHILTQMQIYNAWPSN